MKKKIKDMKIMIQQILLNTCSLLIHNPQTQKQK